MIQLIYLLQTKGDCHFLNKIIKYDVICQIQSDKVVFCFNFIMFFLINIRTDSVI